MKKQKNLIRVLVILVIFIEVLFTYNYVFAYEQAELIGDVEYSQEYLEWLNLDENIKQNSIMPRMYNVYKYNDRVINPLKMARLFGSTLETNFNLKQYISENMVIKNQKKLGSCWTFAALGSLETNLALQNYYNGKSAKVYDFSERHLEYATSRLFLNNAINEYGFDRKVGDGGFYNIAEAYLTNGNGAVEESSMPYIDSSELINISEIQNKKVTSQVYDTTEFPSVSTENVNEIKQMMKNYIKNYGGINASIHEGTNCFNNSTGAIYCNNSESHATNHAVLIVGWDDNYSVEKFKEGSKPTNNGAWIIKDSHGTDAEHGYTFDEIKEILFANQEELFESYGINSAQQITDEFIETYAKDNGYIIENNKVIIRHNDNGYLYVSYDDANIYSSLMGISNSKDNVDYENIYQYNIYGSIYSIPFTINQIYLANIFERNTDSTEYLTQVAINTPETCTCKVYINPNGTGKNLSDVELVQLKAGESETFDAGYHTLEFANPVEITSKNFAVVIEIQGKQNNSLSVSVECNYPDYYKKKNGKDLDDTNAIKMYGNVNIESEKCFYATKDGFTNDSWGDFSKLYNITSGNCPDSDTTIKAFTVSNIVDNSLKNIEITTPPNKTSYFEGENFDKTGMVVKANYNNETSNILNGSSYSITNGNNLTQEQTSVTITYEDKSVNQMISVEKNSIVELKVTNPPDKTEYKEGQSFDKTGMVIEAKYKDGTTKVISDYTITDGNNLKSDQTKVTISYEGKNVEQSITVTQNALVKINITMAPNKVIYIAGQNFDKTGMIVKGTYQDGEEKEIIDYTIEDGTNLSKDQTIVTIKYDGKTTTQQIEVEEKSITEISIDTKPSKLTYIKNKEALDLSGGKIKITYNDGTTENMEMNSESVKVTGFDNTKIGKNIIIVNYQERTAQFEIDIIEEEKAESSNLDNAKCNINRVQAYYYTDNSENDYTLVDVEINNILRNQNNDKIEYYYYLSTDENEQNINNWVKIEETQNDNGKLLFTIDTRDISNYSEISNENIIYLYIKEVAIKGGNQSVNVSKSMKLETDTNVETYINNAKKEDIQSSNFEDDDTTSKTSLPRTGIKCLTIILILISLSSIILFIRYRNLKDIK